MNWLWRAAAIIAVAMVVLACLSGAPARSAPATISLEANCLPAALAQATNEQMGLALTTTLRDDRGFLWELWAGPGGWALTIIAADEAGLPFRCLMGGGSPEGDPA